MGEHGKTHEGLEPKKRTEQEGEHKGQDKSFFYTSTVLNVFVHSCSWLSEFKLNDLKDSC